MAKYAGVACQPHKGSAPRLGPIIPVVLRAKLLVTLAAVSSSVLPCWGSRRKQPGQTAHCISMRGLPRHRALLLSEHPRHECCYLPSSRIRTLDDVRDHHDLFPVPHVGQNARERSQYDGGNGISQQERA